MGSVGAHKQDGLGWESLGKENLMEWYDDSPMYKDERERYFAMVIQAIRGDFISLWEGFEIVYELYHEEG